MITALRRSPVKASARLQSAVAGAAEHRVQFSNDPLRRFASSFHAAPEGPASNFLVRESGVIVPQRAYTLSAPFPEDPVNPVGPQSASALPDLAQAKRGPAHVNLGDGAVTVQVHKPRSEAAKERRPLVLVGGLLQTVSTWDVVARQLSKHQPVILYEARGQGRTELDVENVSMDMHVRDFARVINRVCELSGVAKPSDDPLVPPPIHLGGFSFGGLLAMAFACHFPDSVGRLLISGVGRRNTTREETLNAWLQVLLKSTDDGSLLPLAHRATTDSFTPEFLQAHRSTLDRQLEKTARQNQFDGIKALLDKLVKANAAHSDGEFAAENLASGIHCPVLFIAGEHDKLAQEQYVRDLVPLGHSMNMENVRVVPGVGHASFVQDPRGWLTHANAFLNDA